MQELMRHRDFEVKGKGGIANVGERGRYKKILHFDRHGTCKQPNQDMRTLKRCRVPQLLSVHVYCVDIQAYESLCVS